jgi:hypothetical protein
VASVGRAVAVGPGRIRVGDPDNGYIYQRGRIKLRRLIDNGCGDEPARRMYMRARVIA